MRPSALSERNARPADRWPRRSQLLLGRSAAFRCESEFLRPESGLRHRSASGINEQHDAIFVVLIPRYPGLDDDGRSAGSKLELVLLEGVERGLVLEKQDLAE